MRAGRGRQAGFTYVGLLLAVVVMGLMLTVASRVWSTTEQRERETQLLFAGHAYRMAIASYYAHGHQFPATLQVLLLDDRFPVPTHHLRRLYPDPITGAPDWTLIPTPSGTGIMGVASSSQRTPIKRAGFELIDASFKDSDCYCAWQFIYYPNRFMRGVVPGAAPTSAPGAPTTLTPGSAAPGNTIYAPGSPPPARPTP
jgi:type II secretory pathway pseudopilin PulG